MAVFKYVTRGEQTAQSKQKAYFCAHPDDYGKYFKKISDEILNTLEKENNRHCAFFCLEDANAVICVLSPMILTTMRLSPMKKRSPVNGSTYSFMLNRSSS